MLIPKTWTAAIGINDHMYHQGALYMGAAKGHHLHRRPRFDETSLYCAWLGKLIHLALINGYTYFLTLAILAVWLVHCLMHLVSLITAYPSAPWSP